MEDITMCTQHLLTRFARSPDDDGLKSSKHVASFTLNSCAWRILINVLVSQNFNVVKNIGCVLKSCES